jgi:serine/threonine-protein kinase
MSDTLALTPGLPGHIGPGLVIAGKYRLEQEIGRGSMGTVYRAQHVSLGTRFAIKLISSEYSQSQDARKRFSVEAKAVAKLRSRHVVQVYDDGETPEGNPYIVLEYLDGESLEQRLEREHDLPLADAVRVASHVGRALARAHAQGIVHRDLKPGNVFLVRTDEDEAGWLAKVLDFGIAKLDEHGGSGTTQAGTVLGTPLFMSPEQVRGASAVDHRADLYSLGMCLYHMLTGEFAFDRPNFSDVLIAICTEPLPQLRAKAPWVPEAVDKWFQRACAKEPLDRFQSADEMIEALAAAAGTSAASKHHSVPELRIAPETLVGYAAPALATLQPDSKAPLIGAPASVASVSVTRVLSARDTLPAAMHAAATSPGLAPPALAPVAIAAGGDAWHDSALENELRLPTRSLKPLWIGLGLGLLAVASVAATWTWLGGTPNPASSASHRAPAAPPATATARASTAPPPPTAAQPTTATRPPTPEALVPEALKTAERGAATTPKTKPKSAKARARDSAGNGGPSSDLGF